jgi:tryptophan synthase alpha chain
MTQTQEQNRLSRLFEKQSDTQKILSVYFTAGFPNLADTVPILNALQECGVDMVEIGMPFSDPVADGPTIQESSAHALRNGMTMHVLFEQLRSIRKTVAMPLILMGYVNPVMQFGVERFCTECAAIGIDGVILPDLPLDVFEIEWKSYFERANLHNILLITPQTSKERVQRIDAASGGFLYAVSSAGTTGNALAMDDARSAYFRRLREYQQEGIIQNPVIIGFGIHDKASFDAACSYADGAIIGSAFIKAVSGEEANNEAGLRECIRRFVKSLR